MIGQIQINLSEVQEDHHTDGWYAVAQTGDGSHGYLQVRMLLSSFPGLFDRSKSWLLSDYDVVQISQMATKSKEEYDHAEGYDYGKFRGMKADAARLDWLANELCDKLFRILDTDSSGLISPQELSVILALLGEDVSPLELGYMVAEAKAWGRTGIAKLAEITADLERLHPGISETPDKLKNEIAQKNLTDWADEYEHMEKTDLGLPILDLDDAEEQRGSLHYGISRNEFKSMVTEYWTVRKYRTEASMQRGLTVMGTRKPPSDHSNPSGLADLVRIRKGGCILGDDGGALGTAKPSETVGTDEQSCLTRCIKRPAQYVEGATSYMVSRRDLPPVPAWVSDLKEGHDRIKDEQRTPQTLWWFLSTKGEHVLMRVEGRGMLTSAESGRLFDPSWRNNSVEPATRLKTLTIRSIGSQDGTISASAFSVGWDLMQVTLPLRVPSVDCSGFL